MQVMSKIDRAAAFARRHAQRALMLAVFALLVVGSVVPTFAQTPVPITIDTNSLLTQVNTWTASLDDVVFLGVAISIAIALLTFIGAQILKAFRGSSS
jgi:hypothetical protein